MSEPAVHPCTSCGSIPAPWGYRLPGFRKDWPASATDEQRATRWACDRCKPARERGWRKAVKEMGG